MNKLVLSTKMHLYNTLRTCYIDTHIPIQVYSLTATKKANDYNIHIAYSKINKASESEISYACLIRICMHGCMINSGSFEVEKPYKLPYQYLLTGYDSWP